MADDAELQQALIDFLVGEDTPIAKNGRGHHRRVRIELPLDDLAARVIAGMTNFDLRTHYDVSQTVITRAVKEAAAAGLIPPEVLEKRSKRGPKPKAKTTTGGMTPVAPKPRQRETSEPPDTAPSRKPDDETILDWWIAFDNGDTPQYIADKWDYHVKVVIEALDELGVLFEPRHPSKPVVGYDSQGRARTASQPSHKATDKIERDDDLYRRALRGSLTPKERKIYDALGKMLGAPFWEDAEKQQGEPVVRVRLHHPHGHRIRVPMSHRERKQNRMATSKWRRIVRGDMEAIGIMPRGRH